MISVSTFNEAFPNCPIAQIPLWFQGLNESMKKYQIDSPFHIAAFLAQVGHESGDMNHLEEDLNYGIQRIRDVWPARFPTFDSAKYFVMNAERLGNQVYGGRYGNGPYISGDGYRYRARGPIQITFADNYRACGKALNLALIVNPDLLLKPDVGSLSAGWFWYSHGCGAANDLDAVSDLINIGHRTEKIGDAIGYADREARFKRILPMVNI